MNPSHELMKAYLFLRTAKNAVTNLRIQVSSTKAYIQWNSVHGYYSTHMAYEEQLETEQRDLGMWEERLLEGQIGFVECAAIRSMEGRSLPPEIVNIVRNMLKSP